MSTAIAKTAKKQIIDWQQLPLPAAAEWLAQQHVRESSLDMADSIIVVPTGRSQRRLLELLLDYSERHSLIFTPPEITTVGSFPERLYTPPADVALASPLVQTIAWVEALRATPTADLKDFLGNIPEPEDSVGWQTLAKLISKWHVELSGNGLTFKDVLNVGQEIEFFPERKRWEVLHSIQKIYWDTLKRHKVWDRQNARLMAIKHNECSTDKQIFLVGTADLNPTFRKMLEQVGDHVTAIVFAAPDAGRKFDELGCLIVDEWETAVIPVDDTDIVVADQPVDQAKLVARFLQQLDGEFGIDQISISTPDQRLNSNISRTLIECEIKTHDVGGCSISNTRAFILLELLIDWVDNERYESFAALVRHPDIYAWLTNRLNTERWLLELDNYQNNRLPFYISTDPNKTYFAGKDFKGNDRYANLELAYKEIFELVQPLLSSTGKPLSAWGVAWRQVLVAVYRDTIVDRNLPEHRRSIRACQKIVKALIEIDDAGDMLSGDVSSIDAIQWALDLCNDEFVADPAIADAISMVGWLDTPWEDTSVTILTSVNDGFVPSSENSSLFLPNSVRSQLGLVDNRRRYARDAYATSLILASRKRVLFAVGRRDEDGQPLLPSRLLMTGDTIDVAKRALRLFGEGANTSNWTVGTQVQRPNKQQLEIPDLVHHEQINDMRVTDFRQYLACPYRFYLSRVLGLDRLIDSKDELDAAQFGSLIHDVVENFGRSDLKNSQVEPEIEAHVLECLNRYSLARYGRSPVPTVQIQLEQARIRLRAFARWQAKHRGEGYEIFAVERAKTHHVFMVDGQPFDVRGQIDRIDINHDKRLIGLYDYKTGEKGESPRMSHQERDGTWKDLQLPLYHHLLADFDLPADYQIETGLILIAKDTNQVGLFSANWSESELKTADDAAIEIMRKVRAGIFGPPTEMNVPWDQYAAICQTRVFEKFVAEGGEV